MDKLIVTVPPPLLNRSGSYGEGLSFSPAPEEQLNIFSQIGFGSVVKLVLIWKSAFGNRIS